MRQSDEDYNAMLELAKDLKFMTAVIFIRGETGFSTQESGHTARRAVSMYPDSVIAKDYSNFPIDSATRRLFQ